MESVKLRSEDGGDEMTTEEFAKVGMYVVAFIFYLIGTGIVGVIGMGETDDPELFGIAVWIVGAAVFAGMVVYLKG